MALILTVLTPVNKSIFFSNKNALPFQSIPPYLVAARYSCLINTK